MFTLDNLHATLCDIEVKGKENLDKLLGSILAVEAMMEAQAAGEEQAEEQTGEDDNG